MVIPDKATADAICTAVVAGYALGGSALFQYGEDPKEKEKYTAVREALGKINVNVTVSQAMSADDLPVIVALTEKIQAKEKLEILVDVESAVRTAVENKVRQRGLNNLFGAYIGGYSDTSKTILIGPSVLASYKPDYRAVTPTDVTEIKASYARCKKASQDVDDVLKAAEATLKNKSGPYQFKYLSPKIYPDYEEGKVFASYHGMIRSLVDFQTSMDSLAFSFEIAISGTRKISACFPCATYMTACGCPPSSTHLGRGDNWNIPDTSQKRKEWDRRIREWYKAGKAKVNAAPRFEDDGIVPAVFLEALTFEGSFSDRIIGTLTGK